MFPSDHRPPWLPFVALVILPLSLAQHHHYTNSSDPSTNGSANNYPNDGISIPTSTITFIGLGFIVFALSIILVLLLIRMRKIRRMARSRGHSFRRAWRDDGGFWGFLNALGGESALVGAGGRGRIRLGVVAREKGEDKRRPDMWEVDWANEDEEAEKLRPLAITTSSPPLATQKPRSALDLEHLPILNISVLIALPSAAPPDPDELPDLLIGTTTLIPTVNERLDLSRSPSNTPSEQSSMDKGLKAQVEQVEYAGAPRRARWEQHTSGGWHIESLGVS